jgi:hypothetical protein
MKTLCYQKLLNKIIKRSKMLEREKFLGDKLAQLLVYDVLFGFGVRGKFKVIIIFLFTHYLINLFIIFQINFVNKGNHQA